MDEKVSPLNQVSCDPSWWIEECQAQQTFFEWISQEIVSPMPPWRVMISVSWTVFHTACCESAFFPPQHCCFPWRFNTKVASKFHFQCLHGVAGVRSFMKPDRHQPLLDGIRTLINSQVWNSTAHCKVIARLPTPNQPKVTNTSNLSLDRDPTGGNTNSCEIQRGYTHFSATLYIVGKMEVWGNLLENDHFKTYERGCEDVEWA
jgi:hypothetical protein